MKNKIGKLFNNKIEMGLRISVILNTLYPKSLDKEMINYYDYLSLHTKDIGDKESLHADTPNRFGELSSKRELIDETLRMLVLKGIITLKYIDTGIEYTGNEETSKLLGSLSNDYVKELIIKVNFVKNHFKNFENKDIIKFVLDNKEKWGTEISFCTIGLNYE